MPNITGIPLTRSTDGQVVGQVIDGHLVKVVKRSRHRYWAKNTYCLDAPTYYAHRDLFHDIRIEDVEEKMAYVVDADVMDERAEVIHYKGHGEQLALPLSFWRSEPLAGYTPPSKEGKTTQVRNLQPRFPGV